MGYFVPAAGDDRLAGPYADYDTALAALRADAGASDGDLYQLDSGQAFAVYASEGPGILVPPQFLPQISDYASNASGSAWLSTAVDDDLADVTARGWVAAGAAGGPAPTWDPALGIVVDSSTGGTDGLSRALFSFTPTTGVKKWLAIARISALSSVQLGFIQVRFATSTGASSPRPFLIWESANAGISWGSGTASRRGHGVLDMTTGWLIATVDTTNDDFATTAQPLGSGSASDLITMKVGDAPDSASSSWLLEAYESSSGASEIAFSELHLLRLT